MSVLVECISVIVRCDTLERLYPGGVVAYERLCPNATFCSDDRLTRVGFMTPDDVRAWCGHLERLGLVVLGEAGFEDVAIVDQLRGPTAPCEWLSFGRHVAGYTMAWTPGESPSPMAAPAGWHAGRTDQIQFSPDGAAGERLVPLGRQGKLDVYLDTRTGKEVYVGRTDGE